MLTRWVCRNPSPEPPLVGQAMVSSFWPGLFFIVSTIEIDSFKSKNLSNDVSPGLDLFVTQVFKCDEHGCIKSFDDLLFEQGYPDLIMARNGHKETVDLLSKGKLKLSRIIKT